MEKKAADRTESPRRRDREGGLDEFIRGLPPDELIEVLRKYFGFDEFCYSLIAPSDPEALERLPKVECPPLFVVGRPAEGKTCRNLDDYLESLTPDDRARFLKELEELRERSVDSPGLGFDINLLNTPGLEMS